ncbi:glycosyl hydrolase family 28-related protein [Planococcus sp. N028]|uniref:Glycosyl hydrolase family 28-related protein n=1 Tax=Planococcus shixiaomingii TaxID=3058393 RepID=A0ABT8N1P4_9BACL|nr:glycosyl hydrolase family 28-related protein [Planococcus sp. N028]MDN7241624.1 glycosyl hydrolase family 28-related protein [Planococcus sp. N028]
MTYTNQNSKTDLNLRSKEDLIREMWNPKKTSGQIFNVKSFGAKGDGKADDWRSLQEVIDKVYHTPGGGNLFFPPGTYRISAPLEVPSVEEDNVVSWLGHSPYSTRIMPSKEMDYLVRMRGRGGSIKGIEFRGNDLMNYSAKLAKVCMLATDIRDKTFSNAAFVWATVHGLQITDDGNNNLCVFDRLCEFAHNGQVFEGVDGSGSADKISFLSFNPKANDVHVGAYLKIGKGEGSVYHIDSVSANSIKILPELKRPLKPGTKYSIHIGCGLQTDRGSDNNVYGIYDCHFIGNAAAGLMVRGLYGHHIQGGNFDSNGIAGLHIGSGMISTTPAYSNAIVHSYFEANGYANVILDYPSGLTIIEPLLPTPTDGTAGGVASITSLRNVYFDYESTSVIYQGQAYRYIEEMSDSSLYNMENEPRATINRSSSSSDPAVVKLPPAPNHKFGEVLEVYVEDSGGHPVQVVCETTKVNNKSGKTGVQVPGGIGYKIIAYYSRKNESWMVSYTNPLT